MSNGTEMQTLKLDTYHRLQRDYMNIVEANGLCKIVLIDKSPSSGAVNKGSRANEKLAEEGSLCTTTSQDY